MLTPEQRKEFLATLDSQRQDFIKGFVAKTNFPEDLLRVFCLGGALYEMHMLKLLGYENSELQLSHAQVKGDGNTLEINVQDGPIEDRNTTAGDTTGVGEQDPNTL